MKAHQILCSVCMLVLAMPMLANAQIYKWKDKNGVVRYSDTPPATTEKIDTIGKKNTAKPVPAAPESTNVQPVTAVPSNENLEEQVNPEVEAARMRARNAEMEKKNAQEKERQAKLDAENCKAARANYQSYAQGGRIYKTNENGEREYFGDAELEANKVQAQSEINQYCK